MAVSYSQLPVMTDAVAADDQIAILDVSAHTLKRKDASAMAVVQQDPDTSNSNHEVLLATTDATTQETGTAKKSTNLTFNPSTGNLQATQLNGVTIGNDPKFTDTTYSVVSKTAAGLAPQLPNETTTTKYLRQDGTWSDLDVDPVDISVAEHVLHINGEGSGSLDDKVDKSSIGQANGVAGLDANGKVPESQLPGGSGGTQVQSDWTETDDTQVDFIKNKPTLGTAAAKNSTSSVTSGSADLVESGAVKDAIDNAITSAYKASGSKTCSELISSLLIADNEGNVYNITDSGETTSDFIEGAGHPINAGNDVAIIEVSENTYKFNIMGGFIDLSDYVEKSNTSGLIKNDGTIDTNTYLTADDITDKADKVSGATNGNLAGLNGSGNLTDSGWNGAKDTTSISGNPISISGLKANQLAVNPIITFEPIQAGSGTPSPSNIRAISGYDKIEVSSVSKNIWGENWEVGSINNTTGQNESDATSIRQKDYTVVKPNQAYFLRCATKTLRLYWYDVNHDFISTDTASTVGTSKTSPANAKYLRVRTTDSYGSTYGNNITVAEGSHSVDYEPSVKTTDLSESLGQTVYGATWYPRTGKLDNSHGIIDMGDMSWTRINTGGNNYFRSTIADAKYEGVIGQRNACCSCYGLNSSETSMPLNGEFAITGAGYSGVLYVLVRDDSYSDANVFKTSVTGQKICYELATHGKIQLTPHEISLLKDYAYVSTNGTNIALDYHNGELASLADVSQLGETVNELGNKLPIRVINEDISTYTTAQNQYKVPFDGYVTLQSNADTSGRIGVYIYDSIGATLAHHVLSITEANQEIAIFVKKGTQCRILRYGVNASAVIYRSM